MSSQGDGELPATHQRNRCTPFGPPPREPLTIRLTNPRGQPARPRVLNLGRGRRDQFSRLGARRLGRPLRGSVRLRMRTGVCLRECLPPGLTRALSGASRIKDLSLGLTQRTPEHFAAHGTDQPCGGGPPTVRRGARRPHHLELRAQLALGRSCGVQRALMRLRALLGELQPLQQPGLIRERLFEPYLWGTRGGRRGEHLHADSFARDSSSRTWSAPSAFITSASRSWSAT